ncbi:hypothetical protein THIOSC13_810011 [uncultured Thiomicrorhabdus sp.]
MYDAASLTHFDSQVSAGLILVAIFYVLYGLHDNCRYLRNYCVS